MSEGVEIMEIEDTPETEEMEGTPHSSEKRFVIEDISTLDLEDMDLEEIEKQCEFYLEDNLNVFYSYPYYNKDTLDYQYRITINNDFITLDEVKTDETLLELNETIKVLKSVVSVPIEKALEAIYNYIDIRDPKLKKPLIITDPVINYNLDKLSRDEIISTIENNKLIALFDLYKTFNE